MQVTKENGVEVVPEPKPSSYWRRNKKPALDFLHDSPFAAERQLEDQRFLNELNRNPRLNDFTKMDKLRSVQIAQTKGQSRSVAIKANVVNKVVREASGIHNYTIVPPPRLDDAKSVAGKEPLEPETNPLVRAYAQEAKAKPVVCSFGHRPRSASRTFHPASMKFRLKHGQILPSVKDGKTGVGLPVAVLKKVLHAPKIHQNFAEVLGTEIDVGEQKPSSASSPHRQRMHHTSSAPGALPSQETLRNDLFLSKDEQDDLFANNRQRHKGKPHGRLAPLDSDSNASWVSSIERRQEQRQQKKEPPKPIERPEWNEGFHRITIKAKDRFESKKSLVNPKSDKPLSELLHRFDSMTVYENQPTIFCPEKQELDKVERSGQAVPVPKSVPVKGRPLYSDPWDIQMQQIKALRRMDEEAKRQEQEAQLFQEKLRTIPRVAYYPTTILKQMRATSPNSQSLSLTATATIQEHHGDDDEYEYDDGAAGSSHIAAAAAATAPPTSTSTLSSPQNKAARRMTRSLRKPSAKASMQRLEAEFPHWSTTEDEMALAMTLAKRGDRRALYDFHLAATANAHQHGRALPSAWQNETHRTTGDGSHTGFSDFDGWQGSSMTPASTMGALSRGGEDTHDGRVIVGEESTVLATHSQTLPHHRRDEGGHGDEDGDADGQATVTFAALEAQRRALQQHTWPLEDTDEAYHHQQLLDENTID